MWFDYQVPPNPLIETVIKQEVEAPAPTPPQQEPITWRDNPNGCNEEIEYIAAEAPYYCIPKQTATIARVAVKPVKSAVNASQATSDWYDPYQCTGYVASRRSVGQWNDAITWPSMARAEGYYVGSVPVAGAIGQRGNHVVYVEKVEGDQVYISERNYDYNGSYREMWRPISYFTYIY